MALFIHHSPNGTRRRQQQQQQQQQTIAMTSTAASPHCHRITSRRLHQQQLQLHNITNNNNSKQIENSPGVFDLAVFGEQGLEPTAKVE